jgi:hypothetical protein
MFTDFQGLNEILFLTKAINVITAFTDSAIAGALVYLLHTSRTGYARTQTLINRLIVFCVNTGAATGLSAILVLVFSFALPNTLVYMFFYMNIARLYINRCVSGCRTSWPLLTVKNSLLAALNYRETLKNGSAGGNESDGTHSSNNIPMGRFANRSIGVVSLSSSSDLLLF